MFNKLLLVSLGSWARGHASMVGLQQASSMLTRESAHGIECGNSQGMEK